MSSIKAPAQSSQNYRQKKNFYNGLLTIYGRKPVLEALQDTSIPVYRLHLASSNKASKIIQEITDYARQRNIEISYKSREELSRISRNARQDQGVVADLALNNLQTLDDFKNAASINAHSRFMVVDRIHNPQNLGMIIRSVAAAGIDALFIPEKDCAAIGPLAIKASVGAVFKCPIVRCQTAYESIAYLKERKVMVAVLSLDGDPLSSGIDDSHATAYVLGNETDGVSNMVMELADKKISIPMQNGVESLNVAVTAALIAFGRMY